MARKLSDWVQAFLEWTSEDEPPKIFLEWVAISTIAACLQRKCYNRTGYETFYPNLFVALVGPSGTRKSTAIRRGLDLLEQVGIDLAATVTTKEKLVTVLENLSKRCAVEQERGLRPFEQMLVPHASLTVVASELLLFIPQNDPTFSLYLIDLYDCKDFFRYDTIKRGEQVVQNVFLNLIGGVTPDELQRLLTPDVVGTGLLGRFVFVYSPTIGRPNPDPQDTPQRRRLKQFLVSDLRQIYGLHGQFKPSEEWQRLYSPWYEKQAVSNEFMNTKLDAYGTRRGALVRKLSMIASASRGDSMVLEGEDFERALGWMETAEKRMFEAVSGIGYGEYGQAMDRVLRYLQTAQRPVFFSEILVRFLHVIPREDLMKILFTLRAAGKVKLTRKKVEDGEEEIVVRYLEEGEGQINP